VASFIAFLSSGVTGHLKGIGAMLQTRTADDWGYFEYCARISAKVSKTRVSMADAALLGAALA